MREWRENRERKSERVKGKKRKKDWERKREWEREREVKYSKELRGEKRERGKTNIVTSSRRSLSLPFYFPSLPFFLFSLSLFLHYLIPQTITPPPLACCQWAIGICPNKQAALGKGVRMYTASWKKIKTGSEQKKYLDI